VQGVLRRISEEQRRYADAKRRRIAGRPHDRLDLEQSHFSDSIVISRAVTPGSPYAELEPALTLHLVSSVARDLLTQGIFTRGGVAIGWTYHQENVLFGAGIIRAYQLENRLARVPRIIVADQLASLLAPSDRHTYMKRDSDGVWFLNVLKGFLYSSQAAQSAADSFRDVGKFIRNGLIDAFSSNAELVAKYRWLAQQFNDEVAENNGWPGFDTIAPIDLDEPAPPGE
jgi:hypothetical protein